MNTATLTFQNKFTSGSATLDNTLCSLSHITCSRRALQDKLQKATFNDVDALPHLNMLLLGVRYI